MPIAGSFFCRRWKHVSILLHKKKLTGGFVVKDDWYRSKTWNDEVEVNFRLRLRRARDKSQYLRIQASYLAASHPRVALSLLDQYFSLGEHFDWAEAYVDKARALIALGDVEGAVTSYEAALERERVYPSLKTQAYLDFACLVVEARILHFYSRALEVLESHRDRPMFPVDRCRANGARALLLQHSGRTREARDAANLAMAAASETQSGFRYHQQLGLVNDTENALAKQIAALAT
jgi:tetratricopeptide (TPR) repeat protein